MAVLGKAEVTISDILDGNSISEITNFYKVSSKSSGETAPQTSGGRNLIIASKITRRYYLNGGNGELSEDSNCITTDFIPVKPNDSVILQTWQPENSYKDSQQAWTNGILCYDSNKKYMHGYKSMWYSKTHHVYQQKIPSGCHFIRSSFQIPIPSSVKPENWTFSSEFKYKIEKGNVATDWTPAPEDVGWSTTVPTLTETNKYLWNYEMITGSDGQVISYTEPRVIGVYGDKGQTGSTGATGNGIKSITEYYQISTSNTTAPTTWLTTVPTLTATNKYLWNYEKITYTNGTSVDTAKRVIGVYGDKGQTGATGPAGKGIKFTAITYQASTSGTTAPTGTWNTSVPSVPQGQYLWSRTVITYTDNSTSTTYSVAYIPKNGQNGATGSTGATGTGVASITQQYYLSTSKTTQTGGSWVTSMPTWSSGKYLWTRYLITYKNPTSTAYTSPVCDSSWEAVNEVQVGGRNLARGTSSEWSEWWTPDTVLNSCVVLSYIFPGDIKIGDAFTTTIEIEVSKFAFTETEEGNMLWSQGSVDDSWSITNPFAKGLVHFTADELSKSFIKRFTKTSYVNNDNIANAKKFQFGFRCDYSDGTGKIRWRLLKAERGNRATDWTPAPEDVDQGIKDAQSSADKAQGTADSVGNRVTVAESQIKQVKDSISMMVTDENGSSLMTQTSDGWTFNIGGIQNTLDDARDKLCELTGNVSGLNDTTKKLDSLITDITKKTAYINMATDSSGNPCIELGKIGDPFKVRITNTSVDFIEGSSRIAYISNNALYIEKAIIKNELQIGDGSGFIWRKRSNGNMGLRRT